ncbi:MAG TPA: HIT domain-containing protein [Candidatus Deferrimicrobiaceae bacterium]|nr:HIT domain-containing protein [Candidatus Deferrimicrobiaceae bacterium]
MFSPWRMEYIRGAGTGGGRCIFCLGKEEEKDPERLVLGVYPNTLAICNRYPYNNGHVLLAPRRHVADLVLLSKEERGELLSLVALGTKALAEEYSPEGFNVGMNLGKVAGAGIVDHLHIHLIPRWSGDTNFMTSALSTRVLPESLSQTHGRLSTRFGPLKP